MSTWEFSLIRKLWVLVVVGVVISMASGQEGSAQGSADSRPTKPLPPGPMQAKVKAASTQCHTAARIAQQHKNRQEWNAQLDKMIGLGAHVPDSERKAFLNYLTRNFGPEKGMKGKGSGTQ